MNIVFYNVCALCPFVNIHFILSQITSGSATLHVMCVRLHHLPPGWLWQAQGHPELSGFL